MLLFFLDGRGLYHRADVAVVMAVSFLTFRTVVFADMIAAMLPIVSLGDRWTRIGLASLLTS